MTRLDLIAAAGLPFLVLGCRILPDDGPPAPTVAVPDSWSTRANEPISEDGTPWWDDFGDRELSGVIEEALEQNVDLRTSVARLAAAHAALAGREARAAESPVDRADQRESDEAPAPDVARPMRSGPE